MSYKVIRIKTFDNGKVPGAITIKYNDREEYNYHVFLLKKAFRDDFCFSPYVCVFDESIYKEHVIAKICYSSSKMSCGVWKVIGSTLSSLDMPSLDKTLIDLVSTKDIEEFEFESSACGLCSLNKEYKNHLYDGMSSKDFNREANEQKSWYNRQLMQRSPCSFFTSILPFKSAQKDIKYFLKNDRLFVLRRYNGKIYEGYQWLNLSEEEKETMLNTK